MTRSSRMVLLGVLLGVLLPAAVMAQGTTGQLTGNVTQSGAPLPGVTVTVSSPRLQGTRTTVTNENGAYNFPGLPPGDYTVVFTLEGMQSQTRKANVSLVSTARADAEMKMSSIAESIVVTASSPTVLETSQIETNVKQDSVNHLPMNRNPIAVANLAPGVTATGPAGAQMISGAFSFDSLYLVNGAVINENLRGQPHNLFIEDAIQETTVLQGGVSAEYGRFTGGVVSSITKSGGNEFSGSVRDSLDNPKWTAKSAPTQATPLSKVNNTYEATFGGRIVRDRLWFFTSGRMADDTQQRTLNAVSSGATLGNYAQDNKRHRYEGKLTGQITSKHSVVGSYLKEDRTQTNNCQFGCLDYRTLDPTIGFPNDFKTVHYNGIITNNFMVEADWAKKYFAFNSLGGDAPRGVTDPAQMAAITPAVDQVVTGAFFNYPVFCQCNTDERDNDDWILKGRYFLGTRSLGTHNVVVGYDNWKEQRISNNYQSPTDIRFDVRVNPPVQNPDGTVSIQLKGAANGSGDRFIYFPIRSNSLGSDLATRSIFLNDKWDLNQKLSFNVGARWDSNNSKDSSGATVSNDSKISPRLGAIYDVFGNGRLRVDANYGEYVGRLADSIAGGASAAGTPATVRYAYAGPDLPLMDSRLAIQSALEWFFANGGLTRTPISQAIPGFNSKLKGELVSPNMREYTVGAGTQIGKGYLRGDYINRKWQDFYATFTNLQIGTVVNPANGALADLGLIGNSDVPNRKYWALQFQGQYQLPYNLSAGANYTYSKLRGNTEGETSGAGPSSFGSSTVSYPEFQGFAQNAPTGYLNADQTHKARAWVNLPLRTPAGTFNIGLLERFDSGQPYSASATIPITSAMLCSTALVGGACPAGNEIYPNGAKRDPAHQYASIPVGVTYFFGDRGAYRFDDLIATDLSVQYEVPITRVGLFVKGEVRNAFNKLAHVGGDSTVFTANNSGRGLLPFNPFTTTNPIECPQGSSAATCTAMGANWMKGPNFGKTLSNTTFAQQGSFQLPRTYLFSAGVRF